MTNASFPCMTDDELAFWREQAENVRRQAGKGPRTPCWDCPAWFAAEAQSRGCCRRSPAVQVTPVRKQREDVNHKSRDSKRAKRAPVSCGLMGTCKHWDCTEERAAEALHLRSTTTLSLREIGLMLGGRSEWTVATMIRRWA